MYVIKRLYKNQFTHLLYHEDASHTEIAQNKKSVIIQHSHTDDVYETFYKCYPEII